MPKGSGISECYYCGKPIKPWHKPENKMPKINQEVLTPNDGKMRYTYWDGEEFWEIWNNLDDELSLGWYKADAPKLWMSRPKLPIE